MRTSVKAAKSSAENRGRCVPASSGTSGGSAKRGEDRLGKTRSAVVTAIRICFIISRCPPELPLWWHQDLRRTIAWQPPWQGLAIAKIHRKRQPQSQRGRHPVDADNG